MSEKLENIFKDYPPLRTDGVVATSDKEGIQPEKDIVVLFTTTKVAVSDIFTIAERSAIKAIDVALNESRAMDIRIKYAKANLSFAEAVLMRLIKRGGKVDVWSRVASKIHESLDGLLEYKAQHSIRETELIPNHQQLFASTAEDFYRKTIAANGDGKLRAMHGLATLLYDHGAESDGTTVGDLRALYQREEAIKMFQVAARYGYFLSVQALVNLFTQGGITENEQTGVLQCLATSLKKISREQAQVVETQLNDAGYALVDQASPPNRPDAKNKSGKAAKPAR